MHEKLFKSSQYNYIKTLGLFKYQVYAHHHHAQSHSFLIVFWGTWQYV